MREGKREAETGRQNEGGTERLSGWGFTSVVFLSKVRDVNEFPNVAIIVQTVHHVVKLELLTVSVKAICRNAIRLAETYQAQPSKINQGTYRVKPYLMPIEGHT
jgi:hypothetical protein